MKNKEKSIRSIKNIIKEWGTFTVAELEGHSSPIVSQVNENHEVLMESFDINGVHTTEYVHGLATSDGFYSYDELTEEQLNDVLYLAAEYDAICWKTQERCDDCDF
jgi:hypothetical protein